MCYKISSLQIVLISMVFSTVLVVVSASHFFEEDNQLVPKLTLYVIALEIGLAEISHPLEKRQEVFHKFSIHWERSELWRDLI